MPDNDGRFVGDVQVLDDWRNGTIYIAGPMTGIPYHNYPAFHAAAQQLRDNNIDVVNPAELHGGDLGRPFEYYLRRDLIAMLKCDAIALLDGWEYSRGCTIEINTANSVGIPAYPLATILERAS